VDTQGKGDESHQNIEGGVEALIDQPVESKEGEERIMSGRIVKTNEKLETTLKVVETLEDPLEHIERFQFDEKGKLVDNSSGE